MGQPTTATHRGHVWSWDFVYDITVRGGRLRMLNVIDEFTREYLCIHVDRRINADKVQHVLARLVAEHGAPQLIRSDNGSEFIEKNLRQWLKDQQIDQLYIDPGSPWLPSKATLASAAQQNKWLYRILQRTAV